MAVKASASITIAHERNIHSLTRFYKIASSTSTPTAPTENQGKEYINSGTLPSGWSKAEPAYDGTSTNSLFTCDLTGFTDGSVSWSPVSKSSSYEAAKQAWNEASEAKTQAAEAKTSATNASEYASRALGNLSTVQSVTETLNWITAHGTMTLTSDTALDPSHVYFVRNNDGDYVVGGNHYSVVTEPNVDNISTYYELTIDESLNNYVGTHLSVTSEGLWLLPDAGGNKVLIATGQGQTYTAAGTYIVSGSDILAEFTANGAQIGQDSESHLNMDYHSMQLIDKEGNAYFHVSDLRSNHAAADEYGEGFYAVVTDTFTGDGSLISFLLSSISLTNNYKVYVNGVEESNVSKNGASFRFATAPADGSIITATYPTDDQTIKAYTAGLRKNGGSIGVMSFAEGIRTTASGNNSHAEGYQTTASGSASHTEGIATTASGDYVHAEGRLTTASGDCAHAEGYYNTASGHASHAEGSHTTAIGSGSHAEGELTTASGMDSHVQNFRTIAGYNYQTAIGKYNDNQGASAFEIGNGTNDNNRSNALTVDWQGNVWAAETVTAKDMTEQEIADYMAGFPQGTDKYTNLLDMMDIIMFNCGSIWPTVELYNCTGTLANNLYIRNKGDVFFLNGRIAITNFARKGSNPGVQFKLNDKKPRKEIVHYPGIRAESPREVCFFNWYTDGYVRLRTSESYTNASGSTLTLIIPSLFVCVE